MYYMFLKEVKALKYYLYEVKTFEDIDDFIFRDVEWQESQR